MLAQEASIPVSKLDVKISFSQQSAEELLELYQKGRSGPSESSLW